MGLFLKDNVFSIMKKKCVVFSYYLCRWHHINMQILKRLYRIKKHDCSHLETTPHLCMRCAWFCSSALIKYLGLQCYTQSVDRGGAVFPRKLCFPNHVSRHICAWTVHYDCFSSIFLETLGIALINVT